MALSSHILPRLYNVMLCMLHIPNKYLLMKEMNEWMNEAKFEKCMYNLRVRDDYN